MGKRKADWSAILSKPHIRECSDANRALADELADPRKADKKPEVNENERRYALTVLLPQKAIGRVLSYEHHGKTIELPGGVGYTPDINGTLRDGTALRVECKTYSRRKADGSRTTLFCRNRTSFKAASAHEPEALFVWAVWDGEAGKYKEQFWRGGRRIKRGDWSKI